MTNKLNQVIQLIINNRTEAFQYADNNKEGILEEIKNTNNNYSSLLSNFNIDNIYDILTDLSHCFDLNTQDDFLSGLWASFYNALDKKSKNTLLDEILAQSTDTWTLIHIISLFFKKFVPEDSKHFSMWLIQMVEYVKDDFVNGYFYNSIDSLINSHPTFSLEVLKTYIIEDTSNNTKIIAPILLGNLRKIIKNKISVIDKELIASHNTDKLFIYYASFVFYINSDVLEIEKLLNEVKDNKNSNFEETAFYIAYRICLNNNENSDIKDYLINWLIENSLNLSNSTAQFYCINLIERLEYNKQINIDSIEKIMLNLDVIKEKDHGIWRALEHILVSILNSKKFPLILEDIIKKNKYNFINNLESMSYFCNEFRKIQNRKLFTSLLFSKNEYVRCFIKNLFCDEFKQPLTFDEDELQYINESIFEIVFKEMLLFCHSGKRLGEFFCFLNNKYDTLSNPNLKSFIFYKILYNSINYSQGCYKQIYELKNKSKLIDGVVKKVEEYKNMLEAYKNSPVNSFSFPEAREIAYKNEERKQLEIRKAAMEKSVLFHLIQKPTLLVYGDKHAHRTTSGLSESQDFHRMEASMEIPILSFINICEDRIERAKLFNEIKYLQKELAND